MARKKISEEVMFEEKEKLLPSLEEIESFIIEKGSDDLPTFGGRFEGGIHCQQVPDELAQCIKAILEIDQKIESYLEIGVASGGTTFLFNHFFKPELIVLIDDNQHPKSKLRFQILNNIIRNELIGQSQEDRICQQVKDMAFDLILIDGDHSYPGVSKDVAFYSPLLNPGGFLILHDSFFTEWGVKQMVEELKISQFEFIGEYVSTKHNRPCGIAVFRKKAEECESL